MEANGQTLTIHTDKVYPNLPGLLGDPLFLIVDVQSERDGRDFSKEGLLLRALMCLYLLLKNALS